MKNRTAITLGILLFASALTAQAMGMDDGLITTHGAIKKLLDDKGVKYTLAKVPAYGHQWKFRRLSLRDLLPRLFQQGH